MTRTAEHAADGRVYCLKVDVDTRQGIETGVPRLLDAFAEFGVRATFFLSFGPDNSGKAIWNVFRRRDFLTKMLRTKAHRLYGWRTIVSGTLLPARLTAADFPEIVRRIEREGHEVAVHAWDHRLWQDRLHRMSRARIEEQFRRSFECFETILGRRPRAVAAPAWFATPESLAVQDTLGLDYASDLRGGVPCRIEWDGRVFDTIQIPTTQPCLEELIAIGSQDRGANLEAILKHDEPSPMVLPLHAEVEGGLHMPFLRSILERLVDSPRGSRTLSEVASRVRSSDGPVPTVRGVLASLPGRASRVLTGAAPATDSVAPS